MRDEFGQLLEPSSTARRRTAASPSASIGAALFADVDNIREVMAFPKTQSGAT